MPSEMRAEAADRREPGLKRGLPIVFFPSAWTGDAADVIRGKYEMSANTGDGRSRAPGLAGRIQAGCRACGRALEHHYRSRRAAAGPRSKRIKEIDETRVR